MRLLPIDLCKPGERLAKNIYNEEGLVLLAENVELTVHLLHRLKSLGIDHIYIQDSRTEDLDIHDSISEATKVQALKEIRISFRKVMEESNRRKSIIQPHLGRSFRNIMSMIISDLSRNDQAMIMLTNMHVADHYLYQHSLNVCIYATVLGMAADYSEEQLITLGLGALLHDIGKIMLPMELLHMKRAWTAEEYDEVKKHAEIGYKLLKDEPNIPLVAAHCAYQHHERMDGSGYPRGIIGAEIHEYARWIGMVNAYDAMTTHRPYRKAILPHQAIEMLYAGIGTLYDRSNVEMFRDKIALYPIGMTVQLSSGETGVVVDINSSYQQRPIVRILQDSTGREITQTYEIDLSKKMDVTISNVLADKVEQLI